MDAAWPGHRFALGLAAAVIAVWLIGMAIMVRSAALPPEASGPMLVVFEPGTPEDQMFAKMIAADAKPVRGTWLGFVWVVTGDEPGLARRLLDGGAIGTYAELPYSPSVAGCFAYADAKAAALLPSSPSSTLRSQLLTHGTYLLISRLRNEAHTATQMGDGETASRRKAWPTEHSSVSCRAGV